MAEDLAELHERIAFCRSEVSVLRAEESKFLTHAVGYRKDYSPGLTYNMYARLNAPIPTPFRARAGTTANELRACLDALACQLAVRNGKSTRSVYFPASKSKQTFEDDGMKKIAKLSASDQLTIVGLKPYKEGNPTLFELHEVDRTRKHIRLSACAGGSSTSSLGNIIRATNSSISVGTLVINGQVAASEFSLHTHELVLNQVGMDLLIARNVPLNIPFATSFRLTFQDPPDLQGKPVVESLSRFSDLVESIVSLFD